MTWGSRNPSRTSPVYAARSSTNPCPGSAERPRWPSLVCTIHTTTAPSAYNGSYTQSVFLSASASDGDGDGPSRLLPA